MGFITKINQQLTIKHNYVFYMNTMGWITLKKGFIAYFIISVEILLYVYHLQLLIVVKYSFFVAYICLSLCYSDRWNIWSYQLLI